MRLPRDVGQGERRRGLADFGEGLQGEQAERDSQSRRGKKTIGSCFHDGHDSGVNARLTRAPAQLRGNPQARFQSRPIGSHDLAKFFADSAAGLIVPSVIGWIADFFRLAWGLLYWNTRTTLSQRRGRGGRTYGQNPTDLRVVGGNGVRATAAALITRIKTVTSAPFPSRNFFEASFRHETPSLRVVNLLPFLPLPAEITCVLIARYPGTTGRTFPPSL
jgi:hypothetical protein